MLFRIDFEIAIYPDRIQVSDRRSGRFVDFAAEVPFSSRAELVADGVYFEHALVKAIRKAMSGGFILFDAKATITSGAVALGSQGRQAVRRALRDIGFKTIQFDGIPEHAGAAPLPEELAGLLR